MRLNNRKKICYPTFATYKKEHKVEKRHSNWKFFFWGGFFILVLAGIIYLLVFSSVFKISKFSINGNKIISNDEIVDTVKNSLSKKYFRIIPQDTIFAIAGSRLKSDLLDKFPEIEKVQITRPRADELEISLSERKAGGILCLAQTADISGLSFTPSSSPSILPNGTSTKADAQEQRESLPESSSCFYVDNTGYVYREAPEISGTLLPTFFSFDEQSCRLRAQGVQAADIGFASQVKNELRQAGVDLVEFVLGSESNPDLKAFTGEGWLIYFDPTRSALAQAKILEALLGGELKAKRSTLLYVDLRVEDRVYYK